LIAGVKAQQLFRISKFHKVV